MHVLNRIFATSLAVIVSVGCHDSVSAVSGVRSLPAAELSERDASVSVDAAPEAALTFLPERVSSEGKAMGTHLAFTAFTTPSIDAARARRIFDTAIVEIVRIERLMTTWRSDSDVSRVNAAAGTSSVEVSPETFDVIAASLRTSELSGGAFDITFESLHGLWKFDEDLDPNPPSMAAVKRALPLLDYKRVRLDAANHSVFVEKAGAKIGLGGIAKGYAVDRASKILLDAGLTTFFVQAGGDLYTHGKKPDGSEWVTGIRDPRDPDKGYFAMLDVTDHAFSTAGDYERSYIVGGKRYHHIIDPHTGFPATACRSVTIWAPTALEADEIDDAVFIMGPSKGMKLVESLDGVGAVIVDAKNNLWVSSRLKGKLRITRVPTDGL
jgi:FAD:protein FMN transferase